MVFLIVFAIILAIAWMLDENKRRNKELEYAQEFAEKDITKNYTIEQHYHSDKDMHLNETYDIKGAKVTSEEVIKEEGVTR